MSEFSNTKKYRLKKLMEVSELTIKTGNARSFIFENQEFISTVIPSDFITLFDTLIKKGHSITDLKTCSNKILNIFHKPIENFKSIKPKPNSFLDFLVQNNTQMEKVLNKISPAFKSFVKNENANIKNELVILFEKLNNFSQYYTIKENVLFPIIEQYWDDYRCLQLMWSFHDDIRRNIKTVLHGLKNGFDEAKDFNRCIGDIFFNMHTIKFREEKILFPFILETIPKERIEQMKGEALDIGLPFIQPKNIETKNSQNKSSGSIVDLGTGALNIEQIKLIFNHLPIDITYVDENDEVKYFSTPKKRIFPRTSAIIGRNISNCHPPESVHIVEQIVEAFKNGKKDHADFWIKLKREYILIQYFAVRDKYNNYKGVIEVSQEITDIKSIEGEKRLLDWE